jgi:hypothetical protein
MNYHHRAVSDKEQAAETGCCCGSETAAANHKAEHGSTADKSASDAKVAEAVVVRQKPRGGGCCGSC